MDQDLPALLQTAPGGPPAPFIEPIDAMSASTVAKISEAYLNTEQSTDSIAVTLGLSTREVRNAIKRYGLDKKKAEIIAQVQQEELSKYSKFLLDHRVETAEEHRRISAKINKAAESLVDRAAGMNPDELHDAVKQLKDVASLYRSLSETLSASSAVGARAVSLSGLTAEQSGGFAFAAAAGKKPLVSLSFNVAAPVPQAPREDAMEAEIIEEPK